MNAGPPSVIQGGEEGLEAGTRGLSLAGLVQVT